MIEFRVSTRDRKTLIVGGTIVLSVLALGRGAPAWSRWRRNVAESTRIALLESSKATMSVNEARDVKAAIKRAELLRLEVLPAFVNGPDVSAAAATLASVVGDAATANGLRMGSLQVSGDSAVRNSGISHVRVHGDASGDITGVTQFLAALEGGVPLVSVRELSVIQGEPNAPSDKPESLRVEFVLEALVRLGPVE